MSNPLHLFAGTGLELEYMIVDANTLAVRPITDELIRSLSGQYSSDLERGNFQWSNELALHVLEIKTNGPAGSLEGLGDRFQREVDAANQALLPFKARLMPTAMHPWMDPDRETRLWPHDYSPVYQAYDRIFSCRGHGWSNLQSVHINLPFADDAEFARLHAAIRVVLPLLPALAASSPIMDGRVTGVLDNRLAVYRTNSVRIPSITGRVIPEPVFSQADYQREILQPMYDNIAPLDPEGVLQDEFLNSRGAIARFSRHTIEIRLLDVQESPAADLSIVQIVVPLLRALVDERWTDLTFQKSFSTQELERILAATIHNADQAVIESAAFLQSFGLNQSRFEAGDLWRHLIEDLGLKEFPWRQAYSRGTLSRRILSATGPSPSSDKLREVYTQLCERLETGTFF